MSLTSYRAAPPRDDLERDRVGPAKKNVMKGRGGIILLADLATTYSPAP
jgi:hypothetical protein